MKRIIAAIMILALALTMSGCIKKLLGWAFKIRGTGVCCENA